MATQKEFSTSINNKFLDKHKTWFMEGQSDIRRTSDDYCTFIMGGTEWNRGAHLILNGMDSSRGEGIFEIIATNNTSEKRLHGYPDGRLTWANKDVVCVSHWHNSSGGFYRIYSDGLIEQGGFQNWTSASGIVPLYTPYTTTYYNIQLTSWNYNPNTNASMINVFYDRITTTQFEISVRDHANGVYARPFYWYCVGY